MTKKISTKKLKKVADEFLATGDKTNSVKKILGTESSSTALKQADNILNRDLVRNYIESKAMRAAERIDILAETSDNAQVQLAANKDILDRSGFKPLETNVNINIPMYLPEEVMEKYKLDANKKYAADKDNEDEVTQYYQPDKIIDVEEVKQN